MTSLLYFLFFCSGLSGLIYQVVWVRVFGNVFGNTIYSATLVLAVFMLGLGVGSYLVGNWADRRYAGVDPMSGEAPLLRTYGYFELLIALMGFGVSALLPHLGKVSALVSSYSREATGWYVLSTGSYLARGGIVLVLLAPITMLMGGTLTLLIRHLVHRDFDIGGWRIAVLYGVNTGGAALGCFLTDFVLVPDYGLWGAQMAAVFFNVVAASGALWLARSSTQCVQQGRGEASQTSRLEAASSPTARVMRPLIPTSSKLSLTGVALAMSGFAAMGMEILWVRHFSILLGSLRVVFSLLLTIILIGIGVGSFVSGYLHRRTARPAQWLMFVQALFVASTLFGLATAGLRASDVAIEMRPEREWARTFAELWFNARPILLEVSLPALLMGFGFPIANSIIHRAEDSVGRDAGVLYLSNTIGAVGGSLVAGFLLLPRLGIQGSATILAVVAGLAVVPLHFATFSSTRPPFRLRARGLLKWSAEGMVLVGSLLIGGGALGLWLRLPSDHVVTRAVPPLKGNELLLALNEGLTEVVAVTEVPEGRRLLTNGHAMSSTTPLAQRYMRALVHIPLLSMDHPETVLVIGFGVGNTTHAATLYPSVRRVEVADLSRDILADASYFSDVNKDVLKHPNVRVYVNDGRHHLQMQPPGSYDLITLEPPPIGLAGVAALYSKEFYGLARSRLKPKGYISQWLPAYQVPAATTLAMVRAFVDVFPQSVLVSGALGEFLLLGTNDSRIEIEPARIAEVLASIPAVKADLERLDLGRPREIIGTFVGSARTLAAATQDSLSVTDDRPLQEYGVRSRLNFGSAIPSSVVDLRELPVWCPKCFVDGRLVPLVKGLDKYVALLALAYASPENANRTGILADRGTRIVAGSAYLGSIVRESADMHDILGTELAENGEFDKAIVEFREAIRLAPKSASAHLHLGVALASRGAGKEAIGYLRTAVELAPADVQTRFALATSLLAAGDYRDAVWELRATLHLMPDFVEAHNSLGIALASEGQLDDAIGEFKQALALEPQHADAQRNLTKTLDRRRRETGKAIR